MSKEKLMVVAIIILSIATVFLGLLAVNENNEKIVTCELYNKVTEGTNQESELLERLLTDINITENITRLTKIDCESYHWFKK